MAPDWLTLAVLLPLLGAVAAFILPRAAAATGMASVAATTLCVLMIAERVAAGGPVTVPLGGWGAPLGIELRADGLSVAMLALTGLVGLLVSVSATDAFAARDPGTARQRQYFWPLWLLLLSGLNGVYLGTDLFNLYVMIEIIVLAAVGLTVLSGRREALAAGLEYVYASILGALLFLLGVGLVYLQLGRLDFAGVIAAPPSAAMTAALAVMFVGLALKTALFPLHVWLRGAKGKAAPEGGGLPAGAAARLRARGIRRACPSPAATARRRGWRPLRAAAARARRRRRSRPAAGPPRPPPSSASCPSGPAAAAPSRR